MTAVSTAVNTAAVSIRLTAVDGDEYGGGEYGGGMYGGEYGGG